MAKQLKAWPGTPQTGPLITRTVKAGKTVNHKGDDYRGGDEITDTLDYIQRLEAIGVLEPLPADDGEKGG